MRLMATYPSSAEERGRQAGHAGHTRAHSRCQRGLPGAHQCVPGRQHVPDELPTAVEQRYNRHSRRSPLRIRLRGEVTIAPDTRAVALPVCRIFA